MPSSRLVRARPCYPTAVRLPPAALALHPEQVARRLAGETGFAWLDSAHARPGTSAWSYLCARPARVATSFGRNAFLVEGGKREPLGDLRPLTLLNRELAERRAAPSETAADSPPFRGGWFAMFAYDLGRSIERLPVRAQADLGFPDLYLARHELVLAFDHREGHWWAQALLSGDTPARRRKHEARRLAETLLANLPAPTASPALPDAASTPRSNFTRESYCAAVHRALEYIAAGDIYQVNLSQRFETSWRTPAFELYRRMRERNPASYAAFANLGEGRGLASVSPELFLRMRGREVLTRPIKGTRPRGTSPEEDARLADELRHSAKDRAELTMIVDLERNDLGRVCDYGSVRVLSDGELETHPTVFHRVAGVAGRLHYRRGIRDLLRAAFPGGSVTGAPKIRAMEIIEELEPTRRGPYCGAIGWIGADGDLELNLSIRTALVDERAQKAWYQAGGGIVADSDPDAEYDETLAKARAFLDAIQPPNAR